MDFHIGELVKQRANELGIGPTRLAQMIGTSKQNVYGIFKRKTLDTGLLFKLSNALNCDFFLNYSKRLDIGQMQAIVDPEEVKAIRADLEKLAETERENTELKKEVDYQRRIIKLLEEAKAELEKNQKD